MNWRLRCALAGCLICVAFQVQSQTGHYWTHHYGVRSTLLGNSVIGSVVDLGAVYYNPARIAVIEEPAFLLSADIYEWTSLKFDDAFDEGKNVNKQGFGNAPGFAAGTFKLNFLPRHRFAYAIMGRERTSSSINYSEETQRDVYPEVEGEEILGAGLGLELDSRTRWYSVAWAFPINDKLGVGVTMTAAQTSRKSAGDLDIQALAESGDVGIYRYSRSYNLKHNGILWKLGIAGQLFDQMDWGLTLTTPVIKLTGSGDYRYEEFLSNLDGRSGEDRYTSSTQPELDARVRTPVSLGVGLSLPVRRARLHLSAEWYSSIGRYSLLEAEPHLSQSSGDTIGFNLNDEATDVVNIGFGFEYDISEKVQLFGSFNSDFSAVDSEVTSFVENKPVVSASVWTANFWHYAFGGSFRVKTAEVTLGFSQTHARQQFARPLDFPDDEGEVGFSTEDPGNLRWNRVQLIFGFSVEFGSKSDEPATGDQ